MAYLSRAEIAALSPFALADDARTPLEQARERMRVGGHWHDAQHMGRRWAIGCVALEITQRCNLDCSLCYLSESSEAVKDIPIEEVFRRIDMIRAHYGANTDVQITGGDPTLRRRDELIEIVRRVRVAGLRPSLFTNGIKASRELLTALCQVGLIDVAFHVDMTQERKGYATERELNAVRAEYIERARGLPLSVFFNTTVFDGNFRDIPAVVEFFVKHADVVRLASFQLQADTGRGVLQQRGFSINAQTVAEQIRAGAKADINFDASDAGHPSCNRYAMTLVANEQVYDVFDDADFIRDIVRDTAHIRFDRTDRRQALNALADWAIRHPRKLARGARWLSKKLWRMKADIASARGRVHKLSFFIHNFMDACHLEGDRIDACIFMVATSEGPMSMCLHNAKRDQHLLKPIAIQREGQLKYWNPLSGKLEDAPARIDAVHHTRKTARGRAKAALQTGEREVIDQ